MDTEVHHQGANSERMMSFSSRPSLPRIQPQLGLCFHEFVNQTGGGGEVDTMPLAAGGQA